MVDFIKGQTYSVTGRGISRKVVYVGSWMSEGELTGELTHIFKTDEGLQKLPQSMVADWEIELSEGGVSPVEVIDFEELFWSAIEGKIWLE